MLVSPGFTLVSVVVVVGTLVVVVMTMGFEVATVLSLLAMVVGTDVVVSGITLVETLVGRVVKTFVGFVVDRV